MMSELSQPIEIAENVYWVGHYIPDDPFQCHAYLINNGEESVLIDPGSMVVFPIVLEKIQKVTSLKNIKYIIFHHQDPDITGCLPILQEILPPGERYIVTHWRTETLVKHLRPRIPFYLVDEHNWELEAGERTLEFIFTPYAHFPGAICTYDPQTKIVFSSDIFGAISDKFKLFYDGDPEILRGIELFHKHYMPANFILNYALDRILEKDPELIAPQHGSIIKKEFITEVVKALRDLDCGLYLFEKRASDIKILSKAEEIFKVLIEKALLEADYRRILINLYRSIKKEIPHIKTLSVILFPNLLEDNYYVYIRVTSKGIDVQFLKEKPSATGEYMKLLTDGEEAIGVVNIMSSREFDDDKWRLLDLIINKISHPLIVLLKRELLLSKYEKENKLLFMKSITDPLTGLLNRWFLGEELERLVSMAQTHEMSLSVAIMDLDHFKKINDTYGHLAGDCILKEFSKILREHAKETDITVRYGGEEFIWVMPFTDIDEACRRVNELREKVAKGWYCRQKLKFTFSAGVVTYLDGENIDDFLSRADENLYKAKNSGRNKVVCE